MATSKKSTPKKPKAKKSAAKRKRAPAKKGVTRRAPVKKNTAKRPFVCEVIVGNIGTVYRGSDHLEAVKTYLYYVKASEAGEGRAGGESVTMFEGERIAREHFGSNDDE